MEKRLRCIFIGPLANHAVIGRIAALVAARYEVFLINASTVDVDWIEKYYPVPKAKIIDFWRDPFFRKKSSLRSFLAEYLRIQNVIKENSGLATRLKKIIAQYEPDFAVVHYGAYAIHYARLLKREAPTLPVVDIPNLLPGHLDVRKGISRFLRGWRGKLEDSCYQNWLPKVDGIVYASIEMRQYASDRFDVSQNLSCILPDFLPLAFHGKGNSVNGGDLLGSARDPKVIFLGAPERYGRAIDILDSHFLELAEERIHIYSGEMAEAVINTGFGHKYPAFSNQDVFNGQLADFASQCDAAIIAYNLGERQERFRSTYPTRLFSAITAGLPIAVRRGHFDACERFVQEHKIGFVYESANDLRKKLLDRETMRICHSNIQINRQLMTAEAQVSQIREFVGVLIGKRADFRMNRE